MPENCSQLEWALRYFLYGWQVMPCRNKEPLLPKWENLMDERETEDDIAEWWDTWPDAQIALVCGHLSGVTVIDIDWLKDKERKILHDQSSKPEELALKFHGAPVSITGSGGRHVFLKFFHTKNSTKVIHPQIDVKSEGGYVILPESLHQSGERYKWDQSTPIWSSALLDPPQSLLEACERLSKEPNDWREMLKGVGAGGRNATGSQVAGLLIRSLRNHLEVAWEIFCLWNERNKPPLTEWELKHIFNSILKKDYATNARFYR